MQRTEWPFPTPWAACTEISCLQQYAVVQFIWLPERYYQTGGAALENAVLHEMENGERKQNTYQRFLPGTCCKSPQQNYIDTHCLKILILFLAFFFLGQLIFFPLRNYLSTICHSLNSTAGSQQLFQESVPLPVISHVFLSPQNVCQSRDPVPIPLWTLLTISAVLPHSFTTLLRARFWTGAQLASRSGEGGITHHSAAPPLTYSFVPYAFPKPWSYPMSMEKTNLDKDNYSGTWEETTSPALCRGEGKGVTGRELRVSLKKWIRNASCVHGESEVDAGGGKMLQPGLKVWTTGIMRTILHPSEGVEVSLDGHLWKQIYASLRRSNSVL